MTLNPINGVPSKIVEGSKSCTYGMHIGGKHGTEAMKIINGRHLVYFIPNKPHCKVIYGFVPNNTRDVIPYMYA